MQNSKIRMLTEGALAVGLALVVSYIKIPIGFAFGGFGGSIDFVMIPLIVYAIRWGVGQGLIAGLAFGTMKFFFAGGVAVNWQSMLLDYSLAYMMVGLAGLVKEASSVKSAVMAALIGCVSRFFIHFISGVTIYAEYMPDVFFGMTMHSPTIYSILYNGSYMLPNTIIAVIVCALLTKPLGQYLRRESL